MDPLYSFPLIAQDLRREEYIIQIADSLEHLSDVVNDVFSRLNARIDANANEARNIANRISVCKDKINKLTESNKATKILSEAVYPAMKCFRNYESVFARGEKVVDLKRSNIELPNRGGKVNDNQTQDKLEFFHVKPSTTNLYQWLADHQPHRGLGDVPSDIEDITSLLVFNTKQFAYGLESIKKSRNRESVKIGPTVVERKETIDIIEAAPFSISNRDQAPKKASDSYLYSPGAKEAPAMDMPLDLPHLSGVAEDLRLSFDLAPPSVSHNRSVEEPISSEPVRAEVAIETKDVTDRSPKNPEESVINKQTHSAPAPPPPPPPPPPPAVAPPTLESPAAATANNDRVASKESKPALASDDRSNLMEAIRKAGGSAKAKLRSVKAVEDEKPTSKAPVGGDLMADLHAKLSMRRKGISGDKPKANDSSILSVISAMIPPPVAKQQSDQMSLAEASSTDDDWE